MAEVATFRALDEKEYEFDRWYPYPFVIPGSRVRTVPTLNEFYLLVLHSDGSIEQWTPWSRNTGTRTHWRVQKTGWYEI